MFPVCCCVWKKNILVCIMCVVFEEFLEPSFQQFYCKLYEVGLCVQTFFFCIFDLLSSDLCLHYGFGWRLEYSFH